MIRAEVEAVVAEATMHHPELADEMRAVVSPEDFASQYLAEVFDAACLTAATDQPALLRVHRELQRRGCHHQGDDRDGWQLAHLGPGDEWVRTDCGPEAAHMLAGLAATDRLRRVLVGAFASLEAGVPAEHVARRLSGAAT